MLALNLKHSPNLSDDFYKLCHKVTVLYASHASDIHLIMEYKWWFIICIVLIYVMQITAV